MDDLKQNPLCSPTWNLSPTVTVLFTLPYWLWYWEFTSIYLILDELLEKTSEAKPSSLPCYTYTTDAGGEEKERKTTEKSIKNKTRRLQMVTLRSHSLIQTLIQTQPSNVPLSHQFSARIFLLLSPASIWRGPNAIINHLLFAVQVFFIIVIHRNQELNQKRWISVAPL